jgi:hypothetical protein
MTTQLHDHLEAYESLLHRWIALNQEICDAQALRLEDVENAVAARAEMIGGFAALTHAIEVNASGLTAQERTLLHQRSDHLRQLLSDHQQWEQKAASRLQYELTAQKNGISALAVGQKGLQSYAPPTAHLSRFADQRG